MGYLKFTDCELGAEDWDEWKKEGGNSKEFEEHKRNYAYCLIDPDGDDFEANHSRFDYDKFHRDIKYKLEVLFCDDDNITVKFDRHTDEYEVHRKRIAA